jgi:probable addiction module antidote protein
MSAKTTLFEPADYLGDAEDQIDLLRDAFATGDAGYIADAIGTVVRARNIAQLARETGLTRAGLYKAFRPQGDPKLSTVIEVLEALGFQLNVTGGPRSAA